MALASLEPVNAPFAAPTLFLPLFRRSSGTSFSFHPECAWRTSGTPARCYIDRRARSDKALYTAYRAVSFVWCACSVSRLEILCLCRRVSKSAATAALVIFLRLLFLSSSSSSLCSLPQDFLLHSNAGSDDWGG